MFQKTRRVLLFLHRWVGLLAAILIVVVAGSGAMLIFENEIDHVLNPKLFNVKPAGSRVSVEEMFNSARQAFPKQRVQNIGFPNDDKLSAQLMLGTGQRVFMDPYTGKVLGSRGFNESLSFRLHQLHVRLLFPPVTTPFGKGTRTVPNKLGSQIVGWTTVVLLGISITGIFVWFPRMAWKLDLRTGWKRINFDLHNLTGLYTLVFAIVLTVTGIVLSFDFPTHWINSMFPAQETEAEEEPGVEIQRGVKMITADAAVEAARKAFPDATIASLNTPSPPRWTFTVTVRYPEDKSITGRSRVSVNPYTADVVFKESYRDTQKAAAILRLMRPIHTGDIYGWPTRILMGLASLMIVAQVITGIIMWIVRTFKRKAKEPAPQAETEVAV